MNFFTGPDQLENRDVLFYIDFSKTCQFDKISDALEQAYTVSLYRLHIPSDIVATYGYILVHLGKGVFVETIRK
jgi:hypothetical protein